MLPFNMIPEAHILLFLFLKSPEVGWNAYFFLLHVCVGCGEPEQGNCNRARVFKSVTFQRTLNIYPK